MPYLIALAGLVAAAWYMVMRARTAADMAADLVDVAADVRAAARRFGFRSRANIHPLEAVDDPKVAAATVAVAWLELDGYPTEEAKTALINALGSEFGLGRKDAVELAVLGRWLVTECQGPEPAIARASRRLFKLSGGQHLGAMMGVVQAATVGTELSPRQSEALGEIRRALRLR